MNKTLEILAVYVLIKNSTIYVEKFITVFKKYS